MNNCKRCSKNMMGLPLLSKFCSDECRNEYNLEDTRLKLFNSVRLENTVREIIESNNYDEYAHQLVLQEVLNILHERRRTLANRITIISSGKLRDKRIKCIICHKKAEYVLRGHSLCMRHYEKQKIKKKLIQKKLRCD